MSIVWRLPQMGRTCTGIEVNLNTTPGKVVIPLFLVSIPLLILEGWQLECALRPIPVNVAVWNTEGETITVNFYEPKKEI